MQHHVKNNPEQPYISGRKGVKNPQMKKYIYTYELNKNKNILYEDERKMKGMEGEKTKFTLQILPVDI